jgi:hypothetical protein
MSDDSFINEVRNVSGNRKMKMNRFESTKYSSFSIFFLIKTKISGRAKIKNASFCRLSISNNLVEKITGEKNINPSSQGK